VRNFGSKFVLALSVLTFAAAGVVVMGSFQFLHSEFPDVSLLKTHYPVVHYEGKGETPTVTISRLRPSSWAGLGDISKLAVGAILVSEDWAFYQHKGYDANQIKEAIKADWEEGRFARGASTITQQVVRNVFLDKDKNLWRKLKELVLAVRIERLVGKRRILETYLNIAEWGEGIFGIRAASRHYFGKEPSVLTAREGAFLAMLLPSPKRYSQSFRAKKLTEYARETVESILGKMAQAHYLTEEERTSESSAPFSFENGGSAGSPSSPEESEDSADGAAKQGLPSGQAL
jgi:monofunctional biosynthetic peptidoglycan transglycosylase